MLRPVTLVSLLLALAVSAQAQSQTTPTAPAPAAIQGANIMDVKPDASADPGYAAQTNGERARVQPGNNAPMWRAVGAGVQGVSSLPQREAPEAGVLIQPFVQYPGARLTNAGEAWREVRNQWLIPYGGALLLITLGAIALFYWRVGAIKLHGTQTGRKIERFTPFERSAHWSNAIAFCCLAVSGVVMGFGKFFILPVIGTTLFGWLTFALKNLHNFAGPLFAVSLVIVIITFVRDNLPRAGDLQWLLRAGGMFSDHEVPSHRFNAGEKVVFWLGALGFGVLAVLSGLALDHLLPGVGSERVTMQVSHMVHISAAVFMLVIMLGHIYLGTIGTEGAYQGMKTGYVDETWAREHHELWLKDIEAGRIPAERSAPARSAAPLQA